MGLKRSVSSESGWDNEYEQHIREIPPFSIDSHNVTNREFLAFVHNGGYQDAGLWQDADWGGSVERHPSTPFLGALQRGWYWRGMFAEFPLREWPVYVSRPTAQRTMETCRPDRSPNRRAAIAERRRADPGRIDAPEHGNFDFHGWDPVPSAALPARAGVADLTGTAGNGPPRCSNLFPAFSRSRFTAPTRQIFSTGNTMS
jgi:hypothetical protein